MTNRERFHAVMHGQPYDRLPLAHFGFWYETLQKWAAEGHISPEIINKVSDGNEFDKQIGDALGFDFNYFTVYSHGNGLFPMFEPKFIEMTDEGFAKHLNVFGAIELHRGDAGSIPAEVGYTLIDRESFEKEFVHRLEFGEHRTNYELIEKFKAGNDTRENPLGLHCGSLYGDIRNWMGFENISYLLADDEDLYADIINKVGDLSYQYTKTMLDTGIKFDFIHFWEDICFKNGPMLSPDTFAEYVGPHYKKITALARSYGIDLASVDCDGWIDRLVPVWFENGITTMFPIEVGTWDGNIGRLKDNVSENICGVGGMNKNTFAGDKSDIDKEIERIRPFIERGRYIPCPDHRIPPDAKWETVQYYCDKMHSMF